MNETRFSLTASDLVVRSIHAMASGERADFDELYASSAADRENRIQPPSSRVPGAAGFWSTAQWLRAAFADLHYDIHHAITDGDLVAVNSTDEQQARRGHHVLHTRRHGRPRLPADRTNLRHVPVALVPRAGRPHRRTPGDPRRPGHARQLGWNPPKPAYLVKMARAKRRAARREHVPG